MNSPYPERRRRAIELLGTRVEAEEMLGFLIPLLEAQGRVFDVWARLHEGGPEEPVVPHFRRFVADVVPVATEVLAEAGRGLGAADMGTLHELFTWFHEGAEGEEPPAGLRLSVPALAFYQRAFWQPACEAGFVDRPLPPGAAGGLTCPLCSRLPLLSVLRDEPDKLGGRRLVCSLCSTEWSFPRLTCCYCGEESSEALAHHVSDVHPHIRVDECSGCGRYSKGIDLRVDGNAVPLVDEIASVELDVWARERGLEKGAVNLLGM